MDWHKLQHTLFEMDPTDPAEDLAKLREQAGGDAPAAATTVDYVTESVDIPEGSLEMDRDYSVTDFAALAGVQLNEGPTLDRLKSAAKHGWKNYNTIDALRPNKVKSEPEPKEDPKAKKKFVSPSKKKKVDEGPLVVSGQSQLTDMLQTLLKNWVAKEHSDEEYAELLSAMGYKMQKDGDRTVLVREVKKPKMPKNRNPVASHAQRSGAGVHQDQFKKNKPDRKQKHKKPFVDESIKAQLWAKLNAKK